MSRAALAEKATLASERAKEFINSGGSMVSRARSLVSGDAQFFSIQPNMDDLRQHLGSDSLHEKRDAMKRIIAQMCKGREMSSLFTDVVKNIHTPSIELRKLIYFYITHYAEERPNEALLSISAFQKDLMDSSMHVRSLALRMLSSIRIPAIHPLVVVAVKKCATDSEPLVRKTAAISLAQMHAISSEDEDTETMLELLQQLLEDKCSEVAAAAALSFIEICPDEMQFIHRVYRSICRSLVDCEEWGQVVMLHVLLRYARTQFCDPNNPHMPSSQRLPSSKQDKVRGKHEKIASTNGDDEDEEEDEDDESSSASSSSSSSPTTVVASVDNGRDVRQDGEMPLLDSDHQLLLDSVKPLFMSLNSAVVVAATSLFYHCAPTTELDICVRPLLRLLGGREEHNAIVLSAIHTVVLVRPKPFVAYVKEFFLLPRDTRDVRELKICIMAKLVTENNFIDLLLEFRTYVRSFRVDYVVDAVRGLGMIAARLTSCAAQIMHLLVPLLSHSDSEVVSESIAVLRLLAGQGTNTTRTCRLVHRLLQQVMKGEIAGSSAKASVLWLVGENIQLHSAIAAAAPDCFRVFAKSFMQESTEVKKQVLILGCKIWIFLDGSSPMVDRFRKLFFYVLELARFDEDYDVRDCGRLIQCTADRQDEMFTALKRMLLSEKPLPHSNDPFVGRTSYQLGTMSHLFGNALLGCRELPPWQEVTSDTLLRGPPHDHHNQQNSEGYDDSSTFISTDRSSDASSTTYYSSSDVSSGSSQTATTTTTTTTSDSASARVRSCSRGGGDSSSDDESEDDDDDDGAVGKGCNRMTGTITTAAKGKETILKATATQSVPVRFVVRHIDPTVGTAVSADSVNTSPVRANYTEADEATRVVGDENGTPVDTAPSPVLSATDVHKSMSNSSPPADSL